MGDSKKTFGTQRICELVFKLFQSGNITREQIPVGQSAARLDDFRGWHIGHIHHYPRTRTVETTPPVRFFYQRFGDDKCRNPNVEEITRFNIQGRQQSALYPDFTRPWPVFNHLTHFESFIGNDQITPQRVVVVYRFYR